jgi:hypothetical protein
VTLAHCSTILSEARRIIMSCEHEKQLNEIGVSVRAALAGLTQFPATPAAMRGKPLNANVIEERLRKRGRMR